ncbi:MAG: nucleotidyltransferase family protein [Elusimicrobia bacterium]|nr:nucleotidyltransferase family protein [Elusimicrobiota bacterium]
MSVSADIRPSDVLELILGSERPDARLFDQLKNGQWDSLATLAQRNTVLLRIFGQAQKLGIAVPASIQDIVRAEGRRIADTLGLIKELDSLCSKAGVSFVFTKAFQHYPDMGHDVDLFVMDRSGRIDDLIRQKFQTRPIGGSLFNGLAGKTTYEIGGVPSLLEIHHARLGQAGEHDWYAGVMAERRIKFTAGGVTTFVPSREDQLVLQVVQRVYDHRHLRLSDIVRGFQLIGDRDLNWDCVVKTARQMGITEGLSYYLNSIDDIAAAGARTPASMAASMPVIRRSSLPPVRFRESAYHLPLFQTVGPLRLKQLLASLTMGYCNSAARLSLLPFFGLTVGLRSLFRAALSKTYRLTIFAEAFNMVSAVFVYRLAASRLGHDGFAEFVLTRKAASLLLPAMILGLDVGIARNVAFNRNLPDGPKIRTRCFLGGLWSVLLMSSIFGLVFYFFQNKLAFFLYGNAAYAHLLFPLGLLLAGTCLVNICYSYFQGLLDMNWANAFQIFHYGLLPLAVFFILGGHVGDILVALGAGSLTCAIVAVGVIFNQIRPLTAVPASFLRRLLGYSLPRVPGTFGSMALLNLPAVFMAHAVGLREAGYVALGSALLTMASSAIYPLRAILLPRASSMIADGELEHLSLHILRVARFLIPLALILTVILEIFMDPVVNLILGGSFPDAVRLLRIMALGVPAWIVHMYLRSLIDAYHDQAINARHILIVLSVFSIFCTGIVLFDGPGLGIIIALVLSLYILGTLSFWEMKRICGLGVEQKFN